MDYIGISLTKNEFPCLWEKGGYFLNVGGMAVIIADQDYSPLEPCFLVKNPSVYFGRQGLFVINKGYKVGYFFNYENSIETYIYEVTEILIEEKIAKTKEILYIDNVDMEKIEKITCNNKNLKYFIDAGINKAKCKFCRHLHYFS